jgi:cell wall assembly regulator SMI1
VNVQWLDLFSTTHRRLALRPGCSLSAIAAAEAQLEVSLPASLSEFLTASDGFTDLESQYEYAWPLETIVTENRRAWSEPTMRLDEALLAFGGDGAGDWFCLPLGDTDGPVYHWAWIAGHAREVAPDLASFWPQWLRGSLNV